MQHGHPNAFRLLAVSLAVTGTLMMSGCGNDAQERYDDATEALEKARESRNEARENLQAKQDELQALQDKLNKAEEKLEDAREDLRQAEANVNKNVTDEVLFRSIQRKLLNEERFGEAAISVGVSDRVVTLTGTVPDARTHKAALKVASGQSGVKEVVDFLEVTGADGKQKNGGSTQK